MTLQVAVFHLPLPAIVKFSLVLGVALPTLLFTYHLMVRHTFVGQMLNGKRYERRSRKPEPESVVPSAAL